jgi:hypothetical protein
LAGDEIRTLKSAPVIQTTKIKWFLVGPAAAGLKLPDASGGDDTAKRKEEAGARKKAERRV